MDKENELKESAPEEGIDWRVEQIRKIADYLDGYPRANVPHELVFKAVVQAVFGPMKL